MRNKNVRKILGTLDINYGVERVIILLMHLGLLVSFVFKKSKVS